MKLFQVIELNELYQGIKDFKMPIKTAYKFAMLIEKSQKQIAFYQEEFGKILNTYAQKKDGDYVYTEDGSAIAVVEGKEVECNERIQELRNLEVDLGSIKFTLDELDSLNLTLSQMSALIPLIKD